MTIEDLDKKQYEIKVPLTNMMNAFREAGDKANADLIYEAIDLIENLSDKMFALDEELQDEINDFENYIARQHEEEDNTWSKGVYE